jgi:hypothetical protein
LPVPSATMMPSVGFSLAESGIMMPPFLVSFLFGWFHENPIAEWFEV